MQCLTCNSPYVLYNNQCPSSCPASNYFVDGSNQCQLCNSNCNTCQTTATYCLSCSGNSYLSSNSNSCVDECPSGYYGANNLCNQCLTCLSCRGNGNNCQSCQPNNVLYGSICLSACPSSYYNNNQVCTKCS